MMNVRQIGDLIEMVRKNYPNGRVTSRPFRRPEERDSLCKGGSPKNSKILDFGAANALI